MRYFLKYFFCFLLLSGTVSAQPEIVDREKYPFIKFDQNKIYTPNPDVLLSFYRNLERLMKSGDKQINIVHIGDSHIQADILSDRMRHSLQDFFPGGNGGRGFMFPYAMAHTNNPYTYKVDFTGKWESCRNVQNKECTLGLAGISVTTLDSFTTMHIFQSDAATIRYDCTRIRLFYGFDDSTFDIKLITNDSQTIQSASFTDGAVEWNLSRPVTSFDIQIQRRTHKTGSFTLYGFSMETRDPGIVYHAVGVNGAEVGSFLKCQLLPKQLVQLYPDLVVISLGTNDAYSRDFDSSLFHHRYSKFIKSIREQLPDVRIILTTPGDCYLKGRYPNASNILAREVIFKLAKENDCAVWDYFTTMGGLGSMMTWQKANLGAGDKVHYNFIGYQIQGDLFLEALTGAFNEYLDNRK